MEVSRGDIWTVAGAGEWAGKPRPVIIVQSDAYRTNSLTICPLTTAIEEAPGLRQLISPSLENGLNSKSRVMLDKLTTIARSKLGRRVGSLQHADLQTLNRALSTYLGLSDSNFVG